MYKIAHETENHVILHTQNQKHIKSFIKTNGAVTENIDVIFCDCY